jgi:hypothetical protein
MRWRLPEVAHNGGSLPVRGHMRRLPRAARSRVRGLADREAFAWPKISASGAMRGAKGMNLDDGRREGSRNARGSDAELDALVAREVDALAGRGTRGPPKRPAPRDGALRRAASEAMGEEADAGGEEMEFAAEPASAHSAESNVIGMRSAKSKKGEMPFSAAEEAFIEQSVAFLKDRENADLVLEEIWSHAITERQQAMDEMIADEIDADEPGDPADAALNRTEFEMPEDEESAPHSPGDAAVSPMRSPGRVAPTAKSPAKDAPPDGHGGNGGGRP